MTDEPRACWIHLVDGDIVSGGGMAIGEGAIAIAVGKPGRVLVDDTVLEQLRAGGAWRWNGTALEAATPTIDMIQARAVALWQADRAAEAARRPFLSAGSGQAMEYIWTLDEAREYLAASAPIASDYPLLRAEQAALNVGGQDLTLAAIAGVVVIDALAARTAMAAIKTARRLSKIGIRAAQTAGEIAAALGHG